MPLIALAIAIVGLLLVVPLYWSHKATKGLPAQNVYHTSGLAYLAAVQDATLGHAIVYSVSDTGSMYPYLPVVPSANPTTTIVAYAISGNKTFAQVSAGDLCVYRANGLLIIHQAMEQTGAGWVMSGLNNKHYDRLGNMTPNNFRCVVEKTYVWK